MSHRLMSFGYKDQKVEIIIIALVDVIGMQHTKN